MFVEYVLFGCESNEGKRATGKAQYDDTSGALPPLAAVLDRAQPNAPPSPETGMPLGIVRSPRLEQTLN